MRLSDKTAIRNILLSDPTWCVYALGDLDEAMFPHTTWFTPFDSAQGRPDLTLLLNLHGTTILFAHGAGSAGEALSHVTNWPVHLQVQAPVLDQISRHVSIVKQKTMVRMGWRNRESGVGSRESKTGARRLTSRDVSAIERLYADGNESGEAPDFFFPAMVDAGVFFGINEGNELVAVAGTHLVAPSEGAAAIGNIYTRRDRRGRGLGRIVTSAVLTELQGIETIGLNVRADNPSAIHLYETLGFKRHCEFQEALAVSL